ncbi:MAG: hypothetical protein Q7T93_12835 [Methylobacterium sp.]|nr:hypothetical protein [Methylobacterium sp.]
MPMQSQRGGGEGTPSVPHDHEGGARPQRHGLAPHIVASLAGGLRNVYEARPAADIPDAFADILLRIEAAERALR